MEKQFVISLGGSLIVPDGIDVPFISAFISLIKEYAAKGYTFIIITGGGSVCRNYGSVVKDIVNATSTDLDLIGIASTRLNAEFVRVLLGEYAHGSIIMDPHVIPNTDKPILVGGGWKPGNSSDLAAVECAITIGAKKIVNLSNIDYVYDKDPNQFPDAQPIRNTSWSEFRSILPPEWDPGLHAPFDPVAAKKAEESGMEVVIMNGRNIENFKNYLEGVEYIGTRVQ